MAWSGFIWEIPLDFLEKSGRYILFVEYFPETSKIPGKMLYLQVIAVWDREKGLRGMAWIWFGEYAVNLHLKLTNPTK